MAVTTKKTFSATTNATTTAFTPVGIQLNNQDDLDVYVTLSGGTRVLQLRQSTGSTAQSSHPQVNNTDGLYFPAVTAGTTLYNYTLSTDNNTITFNSALPSGAVVSCERRTRDADSSYTTFASGSTIRATDLNNSSTESNFTAQDARNKAFDLEGKLFNGPADGSIKTKLDGIEANATQDQTASEIRSLVESASDSNVFTDADHSKLDGIEASATADQTAAEIRTLVEAATDSNVFTDADHTKLNNIETGATADQTGAEIKSAYEAESNTNAFTDAEKTKLGNLGSLNALSDVDTTGVSNNKILKYQASSSKFVVADDTGGGGGSSTFTGLSDSPTNYTGAAGKTVKVNSAGNGLEFVTVTTPAGNFEGLTDTPANFTGGAGKVVKVNSNADGLEFAATGIVSADTDPELSSGLDVKTYEINTSTTNGNVKLSPNGTGAIEIRGAGGNDGTLQLNCSQNSHGVKIKSPAHSAGASYTLTLPNSVSIGQPLISDVNGNLSWANNFVTTSGASFTGVVNAFGGILLGQGDTITVDSDNSNTHNISFIGPNTLTKTSAFTLPEDGSNGQFLKTNGSGVLSFADVTSTYNISINTLSSSSGTGGGSATFNGTATRFTLSNAGTNAQAHLVSVNGVIQKPNSGTSPSEGFAIDGNDIIFASAPASGSDFFILTLGNAISIGTPSDNTVTSAKIVDGTIVNADINASAAIAGSKLADDSISEAKLDIHAAPSGTDKVLGYTANGMEWVTAAAGATGGGTDKIFYENGQTVTTNYTITNNTNAMSAGPVTINNGVAVTIGTGENWTIV